MRLRRVVPFLLMAALALGCASSLSALQTQVLLPAQSAAKARKILNQAIQALGGSAYLNVRDSTCIGRLSTFGHSGDLTGFGIFYDYVMFPDKDRTEHSKKRNIIEIFTKDHGWELDRDGVSDASPDEVKHYWDDLTETLDYVLRYRLNEKGMIFRYAGPDVVDLKEADWVELVDSQGKTFRIAIDKITHLPIRKELTLRDPTTQLRSEEIEYFSNYQHIDGIKTPFQLTRTRNGLKVYQAFFDSCKYNTGLPDSLFTKQSLEERWGKVGKKKKKKK